MVISYGKPKKTTTYFSTGEMGCCYNAYPQICKWLWDWEMDRNWKHFWMHGENSLDCIEENVGRNIDNVGNTGEGSDGNEDHGRESCCLRENVYHCKQKS